MKKTAKYNFVKVIRRISGGDERTLWVLNRPNNIKPSKARTHNISNRERRSVRFVVCSLVLLQMYFSILPKVNSNFLLQFTVVRHMTSDVFMRNRFWHFDKRWFTTFQMYNRKKTFEVFLSSWKFRHRSTRLSVLSQFFFVSFFLS